MNAVPRNALCVRVSCELGLISRVARLASYGIGYAYNNRRNRTYSTALDTWFIGVISDSNALRISLE